MKKVFGTLISLQHIHSIWNIDVRDTEVLVILLWCVHPFQYAMLSLMQYWIKTRRMWRTAVYMWLSFPVMNVPKLWYSLELRRWSTTRTNTMISLSLWRPEECWTCLEWNTGRKWEEYYVSKLSPIWFFVGLKSQGSTTCQRILHLQGGKIRVISSISDVKLLSFLCRQYIPKKQQITIDFTAIEVMTGNSVEEVLNGDHTHK